ncbi:MAG: hypothetical protein COW67_09255 [Flavobacteriales bacterium CG18_big_fil_WC_8_21_14_2_50_32_9]|nr:MAG: hypothetical protein COW67_09255 [Flavobacteriales bacterium CG18_big_fil_WC_8_21_14_2_50_32_9]
MKVDNTKATTFKIVLDNKEVVKVEFKPYNGLVAHFSFYGCISSTGYKSHFVYIMDKIWKMYDDVQLLAKDIAQELYNKDGYKYLQFIQQKQQLSLF